MEMIKKIQSIIPKLYQVGGSVRDKLLGNIPKDYDFTTPFPPDEIEKLIRNAGKKPYNIGRKFGTLGMKMDGELIEITTFRTEQYTPGSRKPKVEFVTNITEDLGRRDFTINAMAMNGNGKIIDPFHGRQDLKDKLIRCVGKPKQRFKEDPLRILRGARFAGQLGFHIDKDTLEYMRKMRFYLLNVSKERWCMELDKILMSDNPKIGLNVLMETGVFNVIIPELSLQYCFDQESPYHSLNLWEHTLGVVEGVPKELHLRWSALLHDIGKPFVKIINKHGTYYNYISHEMVSAEIAIKTGLYLKRSNKWVKEVHDLVVDHMEVDSPLKEADNNAK